MSNITKHQNKATVCYKGACATVYGEVAEIVNVIIIAISILACAYWISKILR